MWPDGTDLSGGDTPTSGAVCVPFPGEDVSGDTWDDVVMGSTTVFVADGLGHGPEANLAAERARQSFREHAADRFESILLAMHERLRATRGAAVALARINPNGRRVEFAGVGNISGSVLSASERRSLVFQNGTVGGPMPAVRTGSEDLPAHGLLVLHTDGLTSHWNMDSYPGLVAHHPALVAGVLFRDFARPRDDATVLVYRVAGS
jgi:serine phosphatase RsbU (regulator of sigma subunit)